MNKRLARLTKWLFGGYNHGVPAPKVFTAYELKLLLALMILGLALLWSLANTGAEEGAMGLALIGGLAIYLSYVKYYCTYRVEMDRWAIRELAHPDHPRKELRIASRDLLISESEVDFIARQHRVRIVHHTAPDNSSVCIYETEAHFEHRLLAGKHNALRL